ncbi:flagellar motor protein MotB [Flavobacterium rhamnosiphilum]|uniref:Flagellar motor protein MotB n=1 Tax=Flavobacterium rhamnosiphilum TaxID=2541724 RepID=A0A4V2Z8T1_9FLAO|nr:OmpA family protein [Flavobacterium rhamnosiphilum]TDE41576.1 flagellar motor protein MotB [Flavobacterium rhamnosiphilum]
MKIRNLIYTVFLVLFVFKGVAQTTRIANANKQYDSYAYVDAIATYERIAEKGYKDEKMFQKLGNAYYFNAELAKASKWYAELFAMNQEQEAEYYYRYSQSLKSIGKYAEANKILEQFNKKSGNDQRAKLFASNKNYLEEIKANSGRYDVADAGINSGFSDYGSSFSGNKLIFTSARDTGGVSKKVFKWTNRSFTNLYGSEVNTNGDLSEPKRFGNRINSKFHESTPVFTKDGKTMYFTRNNYLDGKKGKDSKMVTLLKLYKSTLDQQGQWTNVMELSFNSNQYSVAHPALSPDDKTLYFASDMPGTFGQSDLFKVTINDDGSYGIPENLGKSINTEGRETFPFISEDNELYFATDGRPGLGGLDIFVAKIENDNAFKEVKNIGGPINGSQDDFAFLIDSKSRKGFFTSNREGGKGYDDIYAFTEIRKLTCEQVLTGIITDKETGLILANAKVSLFDEKFQLIKESIANDRGQYSFEAACGKTYYVRAEKPDYETKERAITVGEINGKTDLPLALTKAICKVAVGDDLGKCFGIKMIYFDLDKSFIRKEAAFELEKILDVMKQYPKMKIDVRSHTDSRQTAKYNEALSDRRAKSTIAWLIENGIEVSRLTGKGYGESQLVNTCSDGVKCIEAEHQANRRSEFVVVSME